MLCSRHHSRGIAGIALALCIQIAPLYALAQGEKRDIPSPITPVGAATLEQIKGPNFSIDVGVVAPTNKNTFVDLAEPMQMDPGPSVGGNLIIPIKALSDVIVVPDLFLKIEGNRTIRLRGNNGVLGSDLRGNSWDVRAGFGAPIAVSNALFVLPNVGVGAQAYDRTAQAPGGAEFTNRFFGIGPTFGVDIFAPLGGPATGGPQPSLFLNFGAAAFFGDLKDNSAGARAEKDVTVWRFDASAGLQMPVTNNVYVTPIFGVTRFNNVADKSIGAGVVGKQDETEVYGKLRVTIVVR